jgi:hypothetical protein
MTPLGSTGPVRGKISHLTRVIPLIVFIKDGHFVTFPIQKCGILSKVEEIKGLRGGGPRYKAQAIPPIDAEIGQKDHLWMETN